VLASIIDDMNKGVVLDQPPEQSKTTRAKLNQN